MIDNHPFAVVGSGDASPDAGAEDPGIMIWADGVKE